MISNESKCIQLASQKSAISCTLKSAIRLSEQQTFGIFNKKSAGLAKETSTFQRFSGNLVAEVDVFLCNHSAFPDQTYKIGTRRKGT